MVDIDAAGIRRDIRKEVQQALQALNDGDASAKDFQDLAEAVGVDVLSGELMDAVGGPVFFQRLVAEFDKDGNQKIDTAQEMAGVLKAIYDKNAEAGSGAKWLGKLTGNIEGAEKTGSAKGSLEGLDIETLVTLLGMTKRELGIDDPKPAVARNLGALSGGGGGGGTGGVGGSSSANPVGGGSGPVGDLKAGTPLTAAEVSKAGLGDFAGELKLPPELKEYEGLIKQSAEKYNLPPALLAGLIMQESRGEPNAVSSAGAEGLTQLMPGTARELGVTNAKDPAQAIDGGAKYLSQQLKRFGRVDLALAAYNAGPGNVETGRYKGLSETQKYVPLVLGYAKQFSGSQQATA